MSRLVFMLEEPSMKALLEGLLPRLFPDLSFLCVQHEGKTDLEKSLPRKLKAWRMPNDRFVVLRDNDGGDCIALKSSLAAICAGGGRADTLIRIACQELEAWYFGQPVSMAAAFNNEALAGLAKAARYRNPDKILKPSRHLTKLCSGFQKIAGARAMALHLDYHHNTSASFKALIEGIAKYATSPLPT